MTARSRRNKTSKDVRGQTGDPSANAGDIEKDVMRRLGLGKTQSWLFGMVAALTAATLILNGDGLTLEGDNILISLAWSLLAAVLLIVRRYRQTPFRFDDTTTSQQESQSQNVDGRWHRSDVVAAAFFGWVFVSFVVVRLSGDCAPRAMLTMLAHWSGFAAMFVTWRLLLDDRRMIRGMILLFLALIIAETSTAYYDYFYLGPQRRAVFAENRERASAENNAFSQNGFSQGEQELLDNRIQSVEPLGTYSLTNSLAGVLAPWCVFLCGLALLGYGRTTSKSTWQSFARLVLPPAIAFVGFIVLTTHSRSGVIATLFGVVCLLGCVIVAKVRDKRVLIGSAIVACVTIVAALGIGFASGKLNRDTISEATKSFGYRVQYWQSSSMMIADHPAFGCGIGNFREYYTQYKLPTASESIADPHNLFFEIATNAGLPALICFVVLFAAAIGRVSFSKSKSDDMAPTDRRSGVFFHDLQSAWQSYSPFLVGGFVGLVVAMIYSYTNYAPIPPDVACFALTGFVVGCVLFLPIIAQMPLPLKTLTPICLVVLTINLLAAGGISFPHVNVTFWFLTALCFRHATGRAIDSPTDKPVDGRADIAFLGVALCFFALTVVLYPTAYLANLRTNTLLRNMQTNPAQFAFIDKQIAQFERIVKYDPYRTQVWCDLCGCYLLERREFSAFAKNRPDTIDWQSVLVEQLSKNRCSPCQYDEGDLGLIKLNDKTAAALIGAVRSSPLSATMYAGLGNVFLDDYEKTQNRGSLVLATVLFELAAARYPNHAHAYANLALCYHLSGHTAQQVENANRAITFDDITPHSDRKLPVELRRLAEQLGQSGRE